VNRDNINEAVLNEDVLKQAASLYVSQEGENLLRELALLENARMQSFDKTMRRRVNSRIRSDKFKKTAFIAGPIAACLIAALFASRFLNVNYGTGSASTNTATAPQADLPSTPAPPAEPGTSAAQPEDTAIPARAEIMLLSDKLPEGCILTKTDYDYEKTIYYITNDLGNDIVLVTEPAEGSEGFDKNSFDSVDINGTQGYVLAKSDYKALIVQTDDMFLTLTSRFSVGDLIKIAQTVV